MEINNIKQILDKHKDWLKNVNSGERALLVGAGLTGANLREANLSEANLSCANLSEVDLTGANLRGANLTGANLREADLHRADLHKARLFGADLYGADLRYADLAMAEFDFYFTCFKKYTIICANNHFQIGCISRDYDYFCNMEKEEAWEYDQYEGVDFYKNHLPKILSFYKELRNG